MWTMPIVAMEPVEQLGGSLIRALIGTGASPFTKRCLDEALSLTVGPGRVGPCEDLANGLNIYGSAR